MNTHNTGAAPEVDRKETGIQVTHKDNVIFVVNGKIGLEAIEDRIIVLLDKYKSGYECKSCDGTGFYVSCECVKATGTLGLKENGKSCNSAVQSVCLRQQVGKPCIVCKGTGDTAIVPESARAIPTSGVIVSCGPLCSKRKIGERVLFGAHTGYYLPFKGNAKLRSMREDEPQCIIYSLDQNVALDEFVQIEDTQY